MIAVGLALCALWCLAIFGAPSTQSAQHDERNDTWGLLLLLACLCGALAKHKRDRDDDD